MAATEVHYFVGKHFWNTQRNIGRRFENKWLRRNLGRIALWWWKIGIYSESQPVLFVWFWLISVWELEYTDRCWSSFLDEQDIMPQTGYLWWWNRHFSLNFRRSKWQSFFPSKTRGGGNSRRLGWETWRESHCALFCNEGSHWDCIWQDMGLLVICGQIKSIDYFEDEFFFNLKIIHLTLHAFSKQLSRKSYLANSLHFFKK